jgi:hypothetical protein
MHRSVSVALAVGLASLGLVANPAQGWPSASDVARVPDGDWVTIFASPDGEPIAEVGDRTKFGSPTTLGVVRRRPGWLGVVSPLLRNHRLGWVREARVRVRRVPLALTIDLSARSLVVSGNGRVLRRTTVGIGRPGSPTPTGTFSVTDKLLGPRYGSSYGCCIIALSAHQPRLPAGWRGGDRIAIHGTDARWSIGAPASAGCLRMRDDDLRVLMRIVPLGTSVVIRP